MSSQSYIYNPQEDRIAATGAGFQIPRLTTAQRLATVVGPGDAGLTVFDTTLSEAFVWTGSVWDSVAGGGAGYVSVKDFGAVGDGVADDTAAFVAAFAYMAGPGGTLLVPAGAYKITNGILVPNSNFTLLGEGSASVIRSDKTDGTNNFLFQFSGQDVCLSNLKLTRGSNANVLDGVADKLMILDNSVRNWRLTECEIDGNMTGQIVRAGYYYVELRSSGLNGNNPRGITIDKCYWTDCGNRAIDLRGVVDTIITSNRFWRCGINIPGGNPGTCVEIQSYDLGGTSNWSYNATISNNVFQRWGDGAASRTLGLNDTLLLVYVAGQGWNEIAFSNN